MKRFAGILFLLAVVPTASLHAQSAEKRWTVEAVTHGSEIISPGIDGIRWRPGSDEISYIRREGPGRDAASSLLLYDVATGKEKTLLSSTGDPDKLTLYSYQWSPQGDALLIEGQNDLWLVDASNGARRRLTHDTEHEEGATFSPAGDRVAFVKQNNIYTLDLKTGAVEQLTTDGGKDVMNGKLDWVYEEEMANRATGRAYEWSPDGKMIAYLRLDDHPVPEYPITHYLSTHVELTEERFPQAGDPNPIPSFHVVTVGDQRRSWKSSVVQSPEVEYFGPSFSWTTDSKAICFLTLNRHQTELKVHLWNPESGTDRVLVTEEDPYWINSLEPPHFLEDGRRFLWLSERDGWLHLYLYNLDGTLVKQLTRGDWMVERPFFTNAPIFQVDEKSGGVYFVATNPDPRQRQLFRVSMEDAKLERLSKEPGSHSLGLSPHGQYLIDDYSNIDTPPSTRLLKSDGMIVATIDKPANHLGEYPHATTEFVNVKVGDGATLYARLVKPADFDAARKYPVIVSVYGGPHAQVVENRWGVTNSLDQLFAQEGFLVWSLDNRGSWARGHAWESKVFKNLGSQELADQLAGVSYLKSLPYVDGGRLGIWGWSYGGYMTLYTLAHAPDVFKCGAAGGPVTDWTFYDSIYTERYMRTPKENPEGYKTSSPLEAAANLKAKVLLMHGTDDDNVHMQNTMNFVQALTKARIPFELYLQPGEMHGFRSPSSTYYLDQRLLGFFKQNLAP